VSVGGVSPPYWSDIVRWYAFPMAVRMGRRAEAVCGWLQVEVLGEDRVGMVHGRMDQEERFRALRVSPA
jgi:hypothetical protein